jgi:nickel-dependent lactate racemase
MSEIGLAFEAIGNIDNAIDCYSRAISMDSRSIFPQFHLHLAIIKNQKSRSKPDIHSHFMTCFTSCRIQDSPFLVEETINIYINIAKFFRSHRKSCEEMTKLYYISILRALQLAQGLGVSVKWSEQSKSLSLSIQTNLLCQQNIVPLIEEVLILLNDNDIH